MSAYGYHRVAVDGPVSQRGLSAGQIDFHSISPDHDVPIPFAEKVSRLDDTVPIRHSWFTFIRGTLPSADMEVVLRIFSGPREAGGGR